MLTPELVRRVRSLLRVRVRRSASASAGSRTAYGASHKFALRSHKKRELFIIFFQPPAIPRKRGYDMRKFYYHTHIFLKPVQILLFNVHTSVWYFCAHKSTQLVSFCDTFIFAKRGGGWTIIHLNAQCTSITLQTYETTPYLRGTISFSFLLGSKSIQQLFNNYADMSPKCQLFNQRNTVRKMCPNIFAA